MTTPRNLDLNSFDFPGVMLGIPNSSTDHRALFRAAHQASQAQEAMDGLTKRHRWSRHRPMAVTPRSSATPATSH